MAPLIGSAAKGLGPCKRYIATHNSAGKSVYAESPEQVFYPLPRGGKSRSYAIEFPATLDADQDVAKYKATEGVASHTRREIVMPHPGGANLQVLDLEPGYESPFHRTVSIDYSICTVGVVDHELDGGEKVRLYPGDHIVQRGTMHRWINPSSTEPARFVAVTIPCEPFEIPGVGTLKQDFLPHKSKL